MKAVAISSLSAIGSRSVPTSVRCRSHRASRPSSTSVARRRRRQQRRLPLPEISRKRNTGPGVPAPPSARWQCDQAAASKRSLADGETIVPLQRASEFRDPSPTSRRSTALHPAACTMPGHRSRLFIRRTVGFSRNDSSPRIAFTDPTLLSIASEDPSATWRRRSASRSPRASRGTPPAARPEGRG